ncbi:MAG: hypothetical protein HC774_04550 [Sphingomonadales bacterium]|nr:hypothetical protein [Sphingomonadales bacterium]
MIAEPPIQGLVRLACVFAGQVRQQRIELTARQAQLRKQLETRDPALLAPELQAEVLAWEQQSLEQEALWQILDPIDARSENGSDLIEQLQQEIDSITRTSLRVASEASLDFWRERLTAAGVAVSDTRLLNGRAIIDFEDPEGQRLTLVVDGGITVGPTGAAQAQVFAPFVQAMGIDPAVLEQMLAPKVTL